jgi:hypothetical protein
MAKYFLLFMFINPISLLFPIYGLDFIFKDINFSLIHFYSTISTIFVGIFIFATMEVTDHQLKLNIFLILTNIFILLFYMLLGGFVC